ncbi:MAG: S8 family serine peptidase [Flavobacteriales bacterium]|nr:S8 family serine peptidase [Flavobacteriales bacterium]
MATTHVVVVPWDDARTNFQPVVDAVLRGSKPYGTRGSRQVSASVRDLRRLLADPRVQWMEPLPEAGEPEDLRGRAYHRVNRLGPVIPDGTGLDGEDVVVVVNDDGFVGPHVDFKGRTEQSEVLDDMTGGHGDMVAGIIGAAGNIDPRAVGMAPACSLIIAPYLSELPSTVTLHQNADAMIFNSSYSNGCNAGYTEVTQQVDDEVVNNPSIMQVFSAGNDGETDCDYGAGSGWGNITGGHKTGKNVIATANLTDVDGLVGSSSRGPSADGRIKPDISAFGNGQQSNAPDHAYMTGSGTSAAAPGIAGVLALLYQGWRSTHGGADPPSALMKAFLLNTADDLGNTGPDYKYGWGAVNGERAWRAILEDRWTSVLVDDGQVPGVSIDVPAGAAALRVMAYWMDPAGELLAASALVNDIDLAAVDPNGNGHMPWSLSIDPNPTALNTPATNGADHLNNMEQVMVANPVPGTWNFPVYGFDVPVGPQEVFIVYEFMPRTIDIVWPGNGERLATDATPRFRWDTPDRSTPVTIRYSTNGGGAWNSFTLASGQRFFDLAIGDTVLNDLRIRVEQGSWADERSGIITMRTPVQLAVPVNCVDSALLQWPAVQYAESYIVHKLGDRYMQAVDTITSTSYWFTGLNAIHEDRFAVTAIAPGGIVGERSIAIARPHDLVNCMASQDLVVQEVLAPTGPVINCQPQAALTFVVHNAGALPVDGFNAGVRLENGSIFSSTFAESIAPGEQLTVSLPGADLGLLPGTLATMTVWASSLSEAFIANDSLMFSLYVHDIAEQYPYVQNMEDFVNCTAPGLCDAACPLGLGLVNGLNVLEDSLDWRVDSAGTNSAGTGPDVDHTFGTSQGHYVYMEATGPCSGGAAHLLLPCLTVPSGTVALMFSYHMYGSGMGSLHVDLLVNGVWQMDVIPAVEGDQGDEWHPGYMDLSPYAGAVVNVRFRGVRGASHLSDMALDDIHISSAVGVEELMGASTLNVVPTGNDGQYLVHAPAGPGGSMTVHDALGALVFQHTSIAGDPVRLDLSTSAHGVYIVAWSTSRGRTAARIVR